MSQDIISQWNRFKSVCEKINKEHKESMEKTMDKIEGYEDFTGYVCYVNARTEDIKILMHKLKDQIGATFKSLPKAREKRTDPDYTHIYQISLMITKIE